MKFCTFKAKNGAPSWGVQTGNGKIADLSTVAPNILEFLRGDWKSQFSRIESLNGDIDPSEVQMMACVPHPPSMRDGYAFRQHVEAARRNRGREMDPLFDEFPIFYFMNHQAVYGPGPVPVRTRHLEKLDFELEAAIVIGKECRDVKAAQADDYIFGYTIMNDLSARVLQFEEMKLNLGPAKGKDFGTSLGPWLVTRDELQEYLKPSEVGERYDLEMTCEHNGEEVSRGSMIDMTWTFAQIIERCSYGCTLYPGDVIGSGTVGTGCYYEIGMDHDKWVKNGDQVTLKISGLGELSNTFELYEP